MNRNRRNLRPSRGDGKSAVLGYTLWCGLFLAMTAMSVHALQREGDIQKTGDSSAVSRAEQSLASRGATIDKILASAETGR